jgi:histidinol-phosphate aminotransferase
VEGVLPVHPYTQHPQPEFLTKMSDKGIIIKAMDIQDKPCCRVSVGTKDEMELFVSALQIRS